MARGRSKSLSSERGKPLMTFEEATRDAARVADQAVGKTMLEYRHGYWREEEAITGVLLGTIRSELDNHRPSGLRWTAAILTNSGPGAEERKYGADFLIHVRMQTNTENYSKGVLVQAKRIEPNTSMFSPEHTNVVTQCARMLDISAASFVFSYSRGSMRCGAASRIVGSNRRDIYQLCGWTPYRFFLELFRCPIGDPKFDSANISELPVNNVLKLSDCSRPTAQTTKPATRS